jgi:hypothetical protein
MIHNVFALSLNWKWKNMRNKKRFASQADVANSHSSCSKVASTTGYDKTWWLAVAHDAAKPHQ